MEEQNKKESVWDLVRFGLIAMLIVLPIRIFIAQPFVVSGSSMFPTFKNSDYLIIDEASYHFKNPERFDVIVFHYPNDKTKYFIKRIIGLPGETVDINGNSVKITNSEHPTGFTLEQPYVQNESNDYIHAVLKDGEYFVMGDNRGSSSDSRYWGPVTKNLIIGRAFLRLYPFKNMDFLPGYYQQK